MKLLFFILTTFITFSCASQKTNLKSKEVYRSETLIITQVAKNTYQHTSFLQTESFGKVDCNGMIVNNNEETIVFDTPPNNEVSEELINWIHNHLKSKINNIVVTHFHEDCLGGLNAFHKHNICSIAHHKTIEIAKAKNLDIPQESFSTSKNISVGNTIVELFYFGEGHTKDNIVGYYPKEKVLFGGCLIKGLNASKGNLEDANEQQWATTVKDLKNRLNDIKIVIPGHGHTGDKALIDYTIELFSK